MILYINITRTSQKTPKTNLDKCTHI